VGGTTALHLCFGYAARVKEKPSGYSFLSELAASTVDQISIEAAEPKLDCAILARLPDKQIILGVLDLGAMAVETPALVAERIRHALAYVPPERLIVAPDCGLKYLPREVAFGKLQAMVAGAAIVRRELGG
jgi:5-methyltetrahydropteroyltriglutamate--homocysteine methyltransferase